MRRSRAEPIVPTGVAEATWSAGDQPRAGTVGGRRAALPGGRAVVGGLLVAAAAVVVFAAALATAGHRGHPYVVATQALPAGTILGPGDLTTESMTLPAGAASQSFAGASVLIGRTVTIPVEPGQLIETSMLAATGSTPALRPVSVPVDTDSLAGLKPGEPVDVLATGPSGSASSPTTGPVTIVVRDATIFSIAANQAGSAASGSTTVVTLGVSDLTEAESLVQASRSGAIVLIEAEPSDGAGPGAAPGS